MKNAKLNQLDRNMFHTDLRHHFSNGGTREHMSISTQSEIDANSDQPIEIPPDMNTCFVWLVSVTIIVAFFVVWLFFYVSTNFITSQLLLSGLDAVLLDVFRAVLLFALLAPIVIRAMGMIIIMFYRRQNEISNLASRLPLTNRGG